MATVPQKKKTMSLMFHQQKRSRRRHLQVKMRYGHLTSARIQL